ncbi:DUF445 domain-containing protein [Sulfurimonas sp.]|uniref:DUF445 domain-containing protein n=1 Tax=Sulfurimonas sp. TaxID=2022749 RepID=UPI00356A641B
MKFNKSLITNFIAILLILISFFIDESISKYFLFTGLFALSGAITNQLAIHMLFERVPLLYGSGVIPNKFESFKTSIKTLMMEQFFTKEQLENFFEKEEKKIDLTPIIGKTDFSPAYDALTKTVMESSFGGMLGMFGGEKALEGLREPFTTKLKSAVIKITSSESFDKTLQQHIKSSHLSDDLISSVESIIDERLNQMTPKMVKDIIQELIKTHLGWLVVWGGVFGGLIGLISSFIL